MNSHPVLDQWEKVRQGTLVTLGLFFEDELVFTPAPGGRSICEIALHIAHEEAIEMLYGMAKVLPELPDPYPPGDFPTTESIRGALEQVHARTLAYLRGLDGAALHTETTLAWGEASTPLMVVQHMIEHEAHHRGELSLALGILGRTGFDA
jgi:uncharacterized damage-inducible protein DinB